MERARASRRSPRPLAPPRRAAPRTSGRRDRDRRPAAPAGRAGPAAGSNRAGSAGADRRRRSTPRPSVPAPRPDHRRVTRASRSCARGCRGRGRDRGVRCRGPLPGSRRRRTTGRARRSSQRCGASLGSSVHGGEEYAVSTRGSSLEDLRPWIARLRCAKVSRWCPRRGSESARDTNERCRAAAGQGRAARRAHRAHRGGCAPHRDVTLVRGGRRCGHVGVRHPARLGRVLHERHRALRDADVRDHLGEGRPRCATGTRRPPHRPRRPCDGAADGRRPRRRAGLRRDRSRSRRRPLPHRRRALRGRRHRPPSVPCHVPAPARRRAVRATRSAALLGCVGARSRRAARRLGPRIGALGGRGHERRRVAWRRRRCLGRRQGRLDPAARDRAALRLRRVRHRRHDPARRRRSRPRPAHAARHRSPARIPYASTAGSIRN